MPLAEDPFFSVVTPVLNGSRFVPRYLDSLLGQNESRWECIIVDDGSTDSSVELILDMTRNDKRFLVTQNMRWSESVGPASARNLGVKLARGTFICFLDIDDLWLPALLSTYMTMYQQDMRLKFIYSSYLRFDQVNAKGRVRRPPPPIYLHSYIEYLNPIPMLTSCIARDIAQAHHFPDANHEDFIYWSQILSRLKPEQIGFCDEVLSVYNVNSGSLSGNKLKSALWTFQCYRHCGHSLMKSCILFARYLVCHLKLYLQS